MLKIGLALIVIGIIWYLVHMEIYNRHLRKYRPEIFDESPIKRNSHKQGSKITFVVTDGQTPDWIMFLGLPPLPLFLIGIVVTIVALIINAFR